MPARAQMPRHAAMRAKQRPMARYLALVGLLALVAIAAVTFITSFGAISPAPATPDAEIQSLGSAEEAFHAYHEAADHSTGLVSDSSAVKHMANSLDLAHTPLHGKVHKSALLERAGFSMQPLPRRERYRNREILWQIPSGQKINGLLLLLHGCGRRAMSFFYSPEGMQIITAALKRQLLVVAAAKDAEDTDGCWSGPKEAADLATAVHEWRTSIVERYGESINGLEYAPWFGFGASSGGAMIAYLARDGGEISFSAVNVQVAAPRIPLELWRTPTVFTIMSRDVRTKSAVQSISASLKKAGTPSRILNTGKKLVTVDFFFKRIAGMPKSLSREIHSQLTKARMIGPRGDMLYDPRLTEHGIGPLAHIIPKGRAAPYGIRPALLALLSSEELSRAQMLMVAEELNVAWDAHEITCESFDDALDFFLIPSSRKG